MPLKTACPKCRAQYQVPDSAQGKTFKCKKCNSAFKAAPLQRRAKASTGAAPNQDLKRFGLEGLRSQPDIFAAPPSNPQQALGNFAEDPGFADIRVARAEIEQEEEDGLSDIVNNPYAMSASDRIKKKEAKERRVTAEKKKLTNQRWFQIFAVFIPFFMVAGTLGVFLPPIGIIAAIVGLVLLTIVNLVVSIWFLIAANDDSEGAEMILLFLVPFYALFFIFNHWSAMKDVMFASLAIAGCMILGVVAMTIPPFIGALIWGAAINTVT